MYLCTEIKLRMISTNMFNCSRKGLYRRLNFKPQLWSLSLSCFAMFKSIIKAIKSYRNKRLFLRIYFSYLNNPNQKPINSSFEDAMSDFYHIKETFWEEP